MEILFGIVGALWMAFAILAAPVMVLLLWGRVRRLEEALALAKGTSETVGEAAMPAEPVSAPGPQAATEAVAAPVAPSQPSEEQPAPDETETAPLEPEAAPVSPWGRPAEVARPWTVPSFVFATHWLVWVGGAALVIGVAFLVKHSIDAGLLGPGVRTVLSLLLCLGLSAAGEWARRREGSIDVLAQELPADTIAPTLTGAALAGAYATIWAAFAVHGLIPHWLAYAALAGLSFAALGAGILHGATISALGLAGAYVTPALIPSDEPSTLLFAYLFFVTVAGAAILRSRFGLGLAWRATSAIPILGALAWALLWIAGVERDGRDLALAAYLIGIGAAFVLLRMPDEGPEPRGAREAVEGGLAVPSRLVVFVSVGGAALIAALLASSVTGTGTLVAATLPMLGALAVGLWRPSLVPVAIAGAVALFCAAFGISVPDFVGGFAVSPDIAVAWSRIIALILMPAAVLGALQRPIRGLAVGGIGGLSLTLVGLSHLILVPDFAGSGIAAWGVPLAIALVAAGAAVAYDRGLGPFGGVDEVPIAAQAVVSLAGLSLAAAILLELHWLNIALSGLVLGAAWVERQVPLRALRWTILVIAGIVGVRLLLNIELWRYPLIGDDSGWTLYGYGLPALALLAASRLAMKGGRDVLVVALESLSLAFALVMLTLEIHRWVSPDPFGLSLNTVAAETLAYFVCAYGLARVAIAGGGPVARIGAFVVAGLGAILLGPVAMLIANPLSVPDAVGSLPILNRLLSWYVAPGLAAIFVAAALLRLSAGPTGKAAAITLAGLGEAALYLWAFLAVRQIFHGSILIGPMMEGETYAYSVLMTVLAVGLSIAGFALDKAGLRRRGLVVAALTAFKVFVSDMAELEGLARALSFIGLGLSLVAIGWIHRRDLERRRPRSGSDVSAAPGEPRASP